VKVTSIPGVLRLSDVHFWSQTSEQVVGSLKAVVDKQIDEQKAKAQIHSILTTDIEGLRWLTIQIDKDIVGL
jgi:Co/Zn/Cd efflux system component